MDLIVLAKAPVPGRVKTRLIPPCDPQQAAAIAQAALVDTLSACLGSRADRVLLVLDGEPGAWCQPDVEVVPQVGGSLEMRLVGAWSHARGPAVQIGMDTPQITARMLDCLMDRLDRADSLIGLATDGGWWVAGMRSPRPEVFLGVATGQPDTGQAQLRQMRTHGLTPTEVDTLSDVDTWDDALAVATEAPGTGFATTVHAINSVLALGLGANISTTSGRSHQSDR